MGFKRISLGICIGASSIKVAELIDEGHGLRVGRTQVACHDCNPRDGLLQIQSQFDFASCDYLCVTGRKLKNLVNLPTITEPEATEHALRFLLAAGKSSFNALLSLGSENFVLYELNEEGTIIDVRAGNKCASGTGEFFLQQIRRMGIRLEESTELSQAAKPYSVSGRCSVFCKSDCTHALNKGIPKERVCAGLGIMIAEKALEILGPIPKRNVLVVGGVVNNSYVIQHLRQNVDNLVIPEYARVFEALGAAAFAMQHETAHSDPLEFLSSESSYSTLPPLRDFEHLVTFREHPQVEAAEGETVLGLDVGSTTTKAVLVRTADDKICASVYLKTNGDPVGASRQCYKEIQRQIRETKITIVALGVTGSGRYISALHAKTRGIVNEIIAHATAATFFDKDVDTILEIGGQDAKYTFLVNGVPCDYAMNEACSAGTGSFLEEAASESLGIDVRSIQDIAIRAPAPPNFNDQCAAFIGSDIKNASHELSRDNIVAGLVYSICMNYNNRVRGSRQLGRKVFMQGGVCYNRAVPLAMASALGREIIVPPEPGLMGAFGAALEVKQRLELGTLAPAEFSLSQLAEREVAYEKSFACPGTTEDCDRRCTISVIRLNGKNLPFGGICNKYYNTVNQVDIAPKPYDLVAKRQQALFTPVPNGRPRVRRTVGLTRSFLTNLLYPLYYHFFTELGFDVVLSDGVDAEGIKRTYSSFCFPAEVAHGMMMNLVRKSPDYIFLPQISELHVENMARRLPGYQCTCVAVQAEPFYLRSAFNGVRSKILSPELNWSAGWHTVKDAFVELAEKIGCRRERAADAYLGALKKLEDFFKKRREVGQEALARIEESPDRLGIVLFGRSYNAFADEVNMGIPRKFASRGLYCIPCDCLPFHDEPSMDGMTWAAGHDIVRAANFVKRHPQLFGAFVTNFSCGPDSFLVGYFRDIMKTKPSLTLEIDSHTADAGVNTRVEAFLDIIQRYRKLDVRDQPQVPFRKSQLVVQKGKPLFVTGNGSRYSLKDPRVKVVFPSMGRTLSEVVAAAFRGFGVRSDVVPLPDAKVVAKGRANASCKECLPLILITGSMVDYVERHRKDGELLLYFMVTGTGGCRLPQYRVHLDKVIEKRRIEDLATFTVTSENGYGGLGVGNVIALLKGIIVADLMDDVKNTIRVLALDRERANRVFDQQWQKLLDCFSAGCKGLYKVLGRAAAALAAIPLRYPITEASTVLLAGESFVRKDEFSSQAVVEALAQRGILVHRAPMLEWLHYVDYWNQHVGQRKLTFRERLELKTRLIVQNRIEKKIKRILARSGLCRSQVTDIARILDVGEHFLKYISGGEPIIVVGRFFKDILEDFHGMISIGPFACLPTRVVESILTPESRTSGNRRIEQLANAENLASVPKLPFLSIESDGNPFPQVIEAQIEAFCLQVERLHRRMK